MGEYIWILIFLLIAISVGLVIAFINEILGPRTKERMEDYPYECGVPLIDKEARGVFKQGYYPIGLLLILFDIEVAFLFPWAVIFKDLTLEGFIGGLIFLGILTLGFLYEWKKGALEWEK
ncbi:MAG: NADH-quinone oxidoreductase subunit A [Aquificaceae bacterium]|nr:NADH-quinone oxidoreductase subunit A [Aquificaceae bacterium]MDW8236870.1 NADH-quinone oxidoreductase subunit A [Aquificaceae bacterium]